MKRLLIVAAFFEIGLGLMVLPWSMYWDRNYFAQALPAVHALITNNFVRGAVSGLGVINVAIALAELVSMIASRSQRPASIAPSQFAED
jgi:polyferredoxin